MHEFSCTIDKKVRSVAQPNIKKGRDTFDQIYWAMLAESKDQVSEMDDERRMNKMLSTTLAMDGLFVPKEMNSIDEYNVNVYTSWQ